MTSEFAVAVHAMVFLNHKGGTLCSETLAENVCTNPARVRKVMGRLRRAGLVDTKEGAEGGYRFRGDPEAVSLADIARAVEQRIVCAGWHSGDADMSCLIASGMAGIMDGIYQDLDALCMQWLSRLTIADIDKKIFG